MRGISKPVFKFPLSWLLTISFALTGCSFEKPEAPTWDANLAIPLISKHYDMRELIERMAEEALTCDSLGNPTLSFNQHFDTIAVDVGLSVGDVTENFYHQLGAVVINTPQDLELQLELTDYVMLATGEVPELGFTADKDFEVINEFASAEFARAELIISVTNNFDLELDSLTVYIINNLRYDTIATYFFNEGLQIGETRIDSLPLDGRSCDNYLGLSSRLHTPGGTLLSTANKYLEVTMQIAEGATVTAALAQVPGQNKNYLSTIEFAEEHRLSSATAAAGVLNINVANNLELDADLTIIIPGIQDSGNPLTIRGAGRAGGYSEFARELEGMTLTPELTAENMALEIILAAGLPGSGENMVAVNSPDNFVLEANLSGLEFSQAYGIIAPTEIALEPVSESIALPRGFENVSLTEAIITLNVYSEAEIPTTLNIALHGIAGQYLNIETELDGGIPGAPGLTSMVRTDLGNLTDPVPSEVVISGSTIAGDGSSPGTVYSDSKIWGTVEISSPLKFAIGATEIEGAINSTEIEQDDIQEVSERLLSGTIYAKITNHLPFGCEVALHFSGDSSTLYSAPQLVIGPFEVGAGVLGTGGLVIAATVSELVLALSETDLDIIENPVLYIGQVIMLPGTDGQVVNIINSDYLDIEAYLQLNTRLGGE